MNRIPLIITSVENIDRSCGTKAMRLYELINMNIPVPKFQVISSDEFKKYCNEVGIMDITDFYKKKYESLPEEVFDEDIFEIENEESLFTADSFMVRSSSVPVSFKETDEYASMISGAFDSYHTTSRDRIKKSIINVWKSMYSEKAYQQIHLFEDVDIISGIGVIIQEYIPPIFSGITHTSKEEISINWINGHLSALVDGKQEGFHVRMFNDDENGMTMQGIEEGIAFVINNQYYAVFEKLFQLSMKIQQAYMFPQEIEWIFDGNQIWVVQTQKLLNA